MGVCLGHQTMGEAFGGNVVRAQTMMHGKVSPVFHHGTGMFKDLPNPVNCTRYHSLAIDRATLPDCLEITAWTEDGEIMGVRHKEYAVEGVQFHPEALLTEHGHDMLKKLPGRIQRLSSAKNLNERPSERCLTVFKPPFSDGLNHIGHEQRKNHDYPSTSD